MTAPQFSRRDFLKHASLASAAVAFPHVARSQAVAASVNKLNVAVVGVGGRGRAVVEALKDENLVAFCDVDDQRAAGAFKAFPAVPRFRDFRVLLDRLGPGLDAVAVATPDHMHFPVARAALALGKHVFVEKPLTHTVGEARELARLAREQKVATQMGNTGHAGDGTRLLREWVQGGVLGEVREVVCWTNRPIWPQGVKRPDHSKLMPVVPATLDWDLWLGVAAPREFDPAYLPFNWRGFWDFGTGALGDMGCHVIDGPYWALDLTQPTSIEAASAGQTDISAPTASVITYRFPARGSLPPVTLRWHDGALHPALPAEFEAGRTLDPGSSGSLIIGSRSTVLASSGCSSVRIVPETKMQELRPSLPAPTIPRIEGGHFAEWVRACKGGPAAGANFGYAAQLTETVLLGNVAVRARRRLEYDAAAMRVTNLPDADRYLTKPYRPGFGV